MESKNALRTIDWIEIVERLEAFATSEVARTQLREIKPLATVDQARKIFQETQEAQAVLSFGERPFMESLDLFSHWFQRLKREAVLTTLELRDVRRFSLETLALQEVLRQVETPWILNLRARLMDANGPLSAIDHIMTPNGEIRTDASETLYNLHRDKASQTRALQSVLDKLIKAHDMETVIQDKYVTTREGRWVIPVKGGRQHQFPGIIHASSQSKQTVFMEPDEVVPLNNRLRQIDLEIEDEIERLLTSLSHYLRTLLRDLESAQAVLLEADVRFAQAKLADALSASPCVFSEERFELNDVRHPLLVLKSDKVISNSVRLAKDRRILLLSGPNAGGKTVLLKSVGLAAHMARCGLMICAEESSILPFFKTLHIAVGDAQSVDAHLSTFAAHLKVLDSATKAQGPHDLLLIDEICGSTDPEEGSALARSFIEAYAKHGVFAVITSHLGPLKVGWDAQSGVTNGSLEYDSQSGQPTYQFFMGIPGQSLALQTARRVGVDQQVLDRALDFLSPETKMQQIHLREIESMKDELHELRTRLFDETKAAREAKKRYMDLIQQFRQERDQWLDRTVKKAEKKIDEMMDHAQVDNIFRKHERLSILKQELPEVIKSSGPATAASQRKKIETPEDFEKVFPPGSLVFIPSVGHDGVVQGKANAKGEIPILSNSMRLFVHFSQLRAPQNAQNPTSQIVRRSSGVTVALTDSERVIDLRGQKVEDAISQLEVQLDAAALNNEDRVKIVHGHGTEALKKAIRAHLSRSIYVKKWKAASSETGGDGVTWAELKD